jgi:hypothetical protein
MVPHRIIDWIGNKAKTPMADLSNLTNPPDQADSTPNHKTDQNTDHNSGETNTEELKQLLQLVLHNQQKILSLLDSPGNGTESPSLIEGQTSPAKTLADFDLAPLVTYLAHGQWREADEETAKLMVMACDREKAGCLREQDLRALPGFLLKHLDQLWTRASDGQFGFSVQRELYISLGGTKFFHEPVWDQFSHAIGWSVAGQWLSYDQLNFSKQAPRGHLPALGDGRVWFVSRWQGSHNGFRLFIARCRHYGI